MPFTENRESADWLLQSRIKALLTAKDGSKLTISNTLSLDQDVQRNDFTTIWVRMNSNSPLKSVYMRFLPEAKHIFPEKYTETLLKERILSESSEQIIVKAVFDEYPVWNITLSHEDKVKSGNRVQCSILSSLSAQWGSLGTESLIIKFTSTASISFRF
jgi:hypothetical protein